MRAVRGHMLLPPSARHGSSSATCSGASNSGAQLPARRLTLLARWSSLHCHAEAAAPADAGDLSHAASQRARIEIADRAHGAHRAADFITHRTHACTSYAPAPGADESARRVNSPGARGQRFSHFAQLCSLASSARRRAVRRHTGSVDCSLSPLSPLSLSLSL